MTQYKNLIKKLPYERSFHFVDELRHIDADSVEGSYTFKEDEVFYKGHFPGFPLTPGVILTEVMAQIGLVLLGIYLLGSKGSTSTEMSKDKIPVLISANVNYYKKVFPGQRVSVRSEKLYFRLGRLKCKVSMYDDQGVLICKGVLAGMVADAY